MKFFILIPILASGLTVIPASAVGPASIWYTIRGVIPSDRKEEIFGVCLLSALGMTAFTRALAFGA